VLLILSSPKRKKARRSSMPLPGSKKIGWWKPIFILGIFIFSGPTMAAVSTPSIQVPAINFNFGEAEEGSILSHDYIVKNTGLGVLEIAEVRPG
jgi:hypothetical protein